MYLPNAPRRVAPCSPVTGLEWPRGSPRGRDPDLPITSPRGGPWRPSTSLEPRRLELDAQFGPARDRDRAQHLPRVGGHRLGRRAQLRVARGDLDRVLAVPDRHGQAAELPHALPEVDDGRRALEVPGANASDEELAGVELALPRRLAAREVEVLEQDQLLELAAREAQREAVTAGRGHAQLEVAVRVERLPALALDLEPPDLTELRRPPDRRALVDRQASLGGKGLGGGVGHVDPGRLALDHRAVRREVEGLDVRTDGRRDAPRGPEDLLVAQLDPPGTGHERLEAEATVARDAKRAPGAVAARDPDDRALRVGAARELHAPLDRPAGSEVDLEGWPAEGRVDNERADLRRRARLGLGAHEVAARRARREQEAPFRIRARLVEHVGMDAHAEAVGHDLRALLDRFAQLDAHAGDGRAAAQDDARETGHGLERALEGRPEARGLERTELEHAVRRREDAQEEGLLGQREAGTAARVLAPRETAEPRRVLGHELGRTLRAEVLFQPLDVGRVVHAEQLDREALERRAGAIPDDELDLARLAQLEHELALAVHDIGERGCVPAPGGIGRAQPRARVRGQEELEAAALIRARLVAPHRVAAVHGMPMRDPRPRHGIPLGVEHDPAQEVRRR